ncbi:type II toxin-antitoxin system prevent-host-death family antitoxin [Haloechinothrix sp. YIM 98757]|uniref:Antitoxin n=1 Tax=Haloechinothrix aidingensis TaxID=2752311 RepID=A0A838ABH7_9PSEU|nr:type II toxin-antitoxin system prevent-host-death family antitoxin [Haloechinothrix aidingensis]MBA0126593.1 type II toxin-antitoxin system prevent-host-death family antitoxin [Haloechinothrix aidingensis]
MDDEANEERITIRELQRNAADVFDRARHGHSFVVTRRGATVGRILPPDPAEEAVKDAVADGILDPDALDGLPSAAEAADMPPEPSPSGTRRGSDAVIALRDEERDAG